jgi:hypothetical protein
MTATEAQNAPHPKVSIFHLLRNSRRATTRAQTIPIVNALSEMRESTKKSAIHRHRKLTINHNRTLVCVNRTSRAG